MLNFPFKLERPLTFVDLETTGKDPQTCRICEIGLIQLLPDGSQKTFASFVNPEIPIPPDATAKHNITDEMVKDAPTWSKLAPRLINAFVDADLGGYNVERYDRIVLKNEFKRVGVSTELPKDVRPARVLDGYKLWMLTHPRTLTDYVRDMLGEVHEGAHRAEADILNTTRAVIAHLAKCAETLPVTDLQALHELQFPRNPLAVSSDGKLAWCRAVTGSWFIALTLGKHQDVPLRQVPQDYLAWVLGPKGWTDMADDTRAVLISAKHNNHDYERLWKPPQPADSGNATTEAAQSSNQTAQSDSTP